MKTKRKIGVQSPDGRRIVGYLNVPDVKQEKIKTKKRPK